jgi:hypothetical protein
MEFVVFGLTLVGVALFHRRALTVAFAGLVLTIFVRVMSAPARIDAAYETVFHLASEWVPLANLFLVLLGFAVLANQFERSNLPEVAWRSSVTRVLGSIEGLDPLPDEMLAVKEKPALRQNLL